MNGYGFPDDEGKRDSQRKAVRVHVDPYWRGVFRCDGNSRFECSTYLLTLVSESTRRESCTGRIRSKIASLSRGITRICAVTEFTNTYWRWANRNENLPFGSFGIYKGPRADSELKLLSVAHIFSWFLACAIFGQWPLADPI